MNILFYLPLLVLEYIKTWIPRKVFVKVYTPSTVTIQRVEADARNATRLINYKAKKLLTSGHN